MSKRVVLPFVIIIIAFIVFWSLMKSKPEKKVIEKPEKVWQVNTTTVFKSDISPQVTLYGRVETPRKASLNAAVTADVIAVNVLEGTEVDEGKLLVQLDDSDVNFILKQRQADLAQVQASIDSELIRYQRDKDLLENEKSLLEFANKAVERAQKLEESKLVSRSTLDDTLADKQRQVLTIKRLEHDIAEHPARLAQLKAQQVRAMALVEQAELDLQRTQILAPFKGRVAKLAVSVGDRVRPGDMLLTVYDLDQLEVRGQIPGRYVSQVEQTLANNQTLLANATVNGEILQFQLDRLSGETGQNSGGVDGLFKLQSKGVNLPLGTFVGLNLSLQIEHDVIRIPSNALYGLDKVYRLDNGYLEAVKVERVGEIPTAEGKSELLIRSEHLDDQDQIVSTQLPNATTGLRIEAANGDN